MARRVRRLTLVILLLAGTAVSAAAQTFTVSRFDDPPPDGCAPGDCSLREAIIAANSAPTSPTTTISLPAGSYTLSIAGNDSNAANEAVGDLDIRAGMSITGAGAAATIVQAGESSAVAVHRLFDLSSQSEVALRAMTIRNGRDVESESGGCIRNLGNLTLDSVVVTGCSSPVAGGGVASYKAMLIWKSTITANTVHSATGDTVSGGGLFAGPSGPQGFVDIYSSVISNNVATSAGDVDMTSRGGGLANATAMSFWDSVISGNSASNSGGVLNTGTFHLRRTTVSGNKARYSVGGIDNELTMTIDQSTVSNNVAGYGCAGGPCEQADAGGLLNTAHGTMTVTASTLSGNSCLMSGGGLLNASGTVTLSSATVAGNTCRLGGGIAASDTVLLKNSLVANNTATDPGAGDCAGTVTSQGYNLIRKTTGCVVSGDPTGNLLGVDPLIGALLDNGGTTPTRALLPGSPAFNAGNPAGCTDAQGSMLTVEQRSWFTRYSQGRCDIGAYELQPTVALWTTDGSAHTWFLNGNSFAGMRGMSGPGQGWTAEDYSRRPDENYDVLWTADNAAQLRFFSSDDTLIWATAFSGPGSGWQATSYHRNSDDGGFELLWTTDNQAQVWMITQNDTWGGGFGLSGPGPGWKAASYFRATDGSHRVLWTHANQAQIWTITAALGWGGMQGLSGPASGGWTATSFHINNDGTSNLVWTQSNVAQIWTLTADGGFASMVGMSGPAAGWTLQSYYSR